uniref:Uncharacterized protein n=1 Tax=Timema shepardi TaxID=629360 RepID=A0A7R9AM98_TIMSH|nr:unnamed protein product [Timema shepardi]
MVSTMSRRNLPVRQSTGLRVTRSVFIRRFFLAPVTTPSGPSGSDLAESQLRLMALLENCSLILVELKTGYSF